jgi:hypothetical protein
MSIRTPDQRLRVFVGSTLQEMAADRKAVREGLGGLRLTPVMFEEGVSLGWRRRGTTPSGWRR